MPTLNVTVDTDVDVDLTLGEIIDQLSSQERATLASLLAESPEAFADDDLALHCQRLRRHAQHGDLAAFVEEVRAYAWDRAGVLIRTDHLLPRAAA